MKNHINLLIILLALALTIYTGFLFGQSSSSNNTPAFGKFLGYNAAGIDLDLKTNNINRMRLMQTGSTTVNGYTVNNSGFMALSMDPNWFNQSKPYSLLHLNGEYNSISGPISQEFGYRSWMKPGITFTHNGDLMYVGPKRNSQDVTDAVISWSDNAASGSVGPDVLRFLFTDRGDGTTAISSNPLNAKDYDGVEVARMTGDAKMGVGPMWTNYYLPHRALDVIRRNDQKPQFRITYNRHSNVDLGINADFQVSTHGNLHLIPRSNGKVKTVAIGFFDDPDNETDPIDKTFLDVGGLTRIRQLPDSVPRSLITGYKISGVNNDSIDNFLGRIDFPDDSMQVLNGVGQWTDITNLSGCWWESDSVHVWTGHGLNGYPAGNVGVGITGPNTQAKFHVYADTITHGAQAIGISIFTDPGTTTTIPITQGMEIWANGGYMDNIGTRTYLVGNSAKTNVGHEVKCDAQGVDNHGFLAMVEGGSFSNYGANLVTQGSATFNIGAYGEATGAQRNIGIYGKAMVGNGNYAGFFDGDVMCTSQYSGSDESLKNNIQVIDDAATLLNSLNPKSYFYNDIPQMSLNQTKQYGLIAQEIEAVLPELVKEAVIPATIDSLGNIIEEEISFKAIRYNDFIPILIAGFQEQNAVVSNQADQITAQNETINALETQLETQANQLEEIQNNMQEMLATLQAMQEITASCCTSNSGSGATGDLNNGSKAEPELEQNIPNPFDGNTRITFSLPETAQVILEITDATGRPIERLIDEQMRNGIHAVTWDGSKVASGIYFYTLYADGKLITKKMIKR